MFDFSRFIILVILAGIILSGAWILKRLPPSSAKRFLWRHAKLGIPLFLFLALSSVQPHFLTSEWVNVPFLIMRDWVCISLLAVWMLSGGYLLGGIPFGFVLRGWDIYEANLWVEQRYNRLLYWREHRRMLWWVMVGCVLGPITIVYFYALYKFYNIYTFTMNIIR